LMFVTCERQNRQDQSSPCTFLGIPTVTYCISFKNFIMPLPVIPQLERSRQKAARNRSLLSPPDPQCQCPVALESGCDQTSSDLLCKHRELQDVVSSKNNDPSPRSSLAVSDTSSSGSSSPDPALSDSFSRSGPFSDPKWTSEIQVWKQRRKGGNRAPKVEPEGTTNWRARSSSVAMETKVRKVPLASRDSEEQKGHLEARINVRLPGLGNNSGISPVSPSVACPSEGTTIASEKVKEGERRFRAPWTEYHSFYLRGRSRFFPNTLSDEENIIRNYKLLCKELNVL
jgi:hypothetical protein